MIPDEGLVMIKALLLTIIAVPVVFILAGIFIRLGI